MKKIIIFDLDGVLIDSKKNMSFSWREVKKKFHIKIAFKKYFEYLGLPFLEILKKLNINKNQIQIEKYYKKISNKKLNKIKLYPRVKKTLEYLFNNNYILGIVTSKDKFRTNKILSNLKIKIFFTFISCPSKLLKSKPYPDHILYNVKKFNVKKKNIYYIGDTLIDYLTAKSARVNFIFAKYGYGKLNYNLNINSFSEILKKIKNVD